MLIAKAFRVIVNSGKTSFLDKKSDSVPEKSEVSVQLRIWLRGGRKPEC